MRSAILLLAISTFSLPAWAGDNLAAVPRLSAPAPQTRPVGAEGYSAGAETVGLTRSEALKELDKAGFKLVTRLAKDDEGNWIGAARYQGRIVDVAVDSLGGVVAW